jgi:CPA1 family monovalent cation:H+ antiporter
MQSRLDLLPRQTSTRLLSHSVWAMLEFAFNGLIFLLLGLQLPDIVRAVIAHGEAFWPQLGMLWVDVLAVFAVLMLLRFAWMSAYWRLALYLRRWSGQPISFEAPAQLRVSLVLTLSGVRGAVTLAGVLSLPLLMADGQAFPQRDLLIFIAAGVILISLLMASIGLPMLLRGLPKEDGKGREEERRRLWHKTAEAAIRELEAQSDDMGEDAELAALATETKARLMAEYRAQLSEEESEGLDRERARTLKAYDARLRLLALRAQRLELYRLRREHLLDDEIVSGLLRELDIREAQLAQG